MEKKGEREVIEKKVVGRRGKVKNGMVGKKG